MSHIFISYSRENIDFARYLRALLENQGFWVWMDEKRLSAGMDWWDEIEANIDSCAAFVVIMSPASRESIFVRNEILRAIDQNRALFPVLYQGKHFGMLAHVHHEDMRAGLNADLSHEFIQGLIDAVGLRSKRTVRVEVVQADILEFETDVLIMKYAKQFLGSDAVVRRRLSQEASIEVPEEPLKEVGAYQLLRDYLNIPVR